jgi:hypothetical protein
MNSYFVKYAARLDKVEKNDVECFSLSYISVIEVRVHDFLKKKVLHVDLNIALKDWFNDFSKMFDCSKVDKIKISDTNFFQKCVFFRI